MERLTMMSDKGGLAFTFDLDISGERSEIGKIVKLGEKLKSYEDAEEQGLLLRLPCRIGDTVYMIYDGVIKMRWVTAIMCNDWLNGWKIKIGLFGSYGLTDIGKTVFLTREAAEGALKGGEGE